MMKRLVALAVAGFLHSPVSAAPPKLIVVISVDQLSADLFDQYRGQFTGGLARLSSGTVFRNGFQSHAASETCPGHSTILTGDRPARTGIIANAWVDQSIARADKNVYCAEDERVAGSSSSKYTVSAVHLKVPTLGEYMKRQWPASRNVAVAGKDRSAVMMGGHNADQIWYWSGKGFAAGIAGVAAPASIAATNAAIAQALSSARPALEPAPFCAAKALPITIPEHSAVGNGAFARAAGDAAAFRSSPEFDGATLALSAALAHEMKLGQGRTPDILSIGLAATDYVGHYFGSGGQEMCLQLMSLDRDLGDFLAVLDAGGADYAVALTADHGGEDVPERLKANGDAAAQRVDPELSAAAIGKKVGALLNLSGAILRGDVNGDVYLDSELSQPDRARALKAAVEAYRAHPQVAAVFTKDELGLTAIPASTPDRWSLIERARASFDPKRSGDLYVILREGVTPIGHATGAVATHGSPWDYDRRVPILFWRKGGAPAQREEAVETIDIMPTLAAMIGVPLAAGAIDGKCLSNISTVACPTR
ncbi:MAG: alkaline phosphatase family protein [Sphingomicrobium sp.]